MFSHSIENTFAGKDDVRIFYRGWKPQGAARAVLVICHGFNSHGGQYGWVAEQAVARELVVFALDLRGRGLSEGERFYVNAADDYASDVGQLVKIAKQSYPGLPVFLLGHSAGGVVSCLYALDHQAELAGLICESFAFEVPAPGFALSAIKAISHVAPRLPVLKLKNEDFTRDREALRALSDDPLIEGEIQPSKTVAAMVRADERLRKEFPRMTLPVLIMHGTADKATLPHGSQFFYDTVGSRDKALKLYEAHFHDLFSDTGKEEVMADTLAWVDRRITRRTNEGAVI